MNNIRMIKNILSEATMQLSDIVAIKNETINLILFHFSNITKVTTSIDINFSKGKFISWEKHDNGTYTVWLTNNKHDDIIEFEEYFELNKNSEIRGKFNSLKFNI